MKQRFGGLLCLLLGSVLLTGGVLGAGDAGAGSVMPQCGGLQVGLPQPCPTGSIVITENTTGTGLGVPSGGWTVTLTSSNCRLPGTVSKITVQVPDGGPATVSGLFQNVGGFDTTACRYLLAETPVPSYTGTFEPVGPYTLPQSSESSARVVLHNVGFIPATPTPTATPTATPAATPRATASAAPSPAPSPTTAGNGSGGTLPFTGSGHLLAQVVIGLGLLLLGVFLLLTGRRTRRV